MHRWRLPNEGLVSFQPLPGESNKACENIHHLKDVVALYLVSKALYIRNLEPFDPLLGNIIT